jgi:diguanylate cyclase (GGDEF)-like protein/PAS domain S-box-containing protein
VTRIEQPDATAILNSVGEAAYEWRLDSDALAWSGNAAAVLGVDIAEAASGRAFARHVEAANGQSRFEVVTGSTQADGGTGVAYQTEYAFRRADGEKIWIEDNGRWFAGPDGKPLRGYGVVRSIDARHERERKLLQLAHFDPLTGEMNRAHLFEVLGGILDEAIRFRNSCGFLVVAIDHLGRLNEAYGFDVTEQVIAELAKRIHPKLRGEDRLGRFSGNKFGVILKTCTPEELSVAAERLLAAVRDEPMETNAGPVAVTITIGGVTAPRHARTVPEILSRAQDALDAARAKRHGSFAAYRPNVEREALRKESVRATDEIVAALNERRIALAFEPVVEAHRRRIGFYECLMRVNRPDGSIAHANAIIPVAERVGLVRMLDHRVLELVVQELAETPDLRASVNVSPASTIDPDWWAGLGALLRAHASAAERLIIEITETAAIQDLDDTRGFVARVKDLGCRIAIDDFGAGYTSFRNLRKLGVDIIKIDGAFVQNIIKSEDDRAFVHTLVDLARRLGLKTVAEWVQDEQAAVTLTDWGCDYLQGALVGLASSERPWRAKITPSAVSAYPPLFLIAELIQPLLHLVELLLELVDIAAAGRGFIHFGLGLAAREGREHGESLLEHLHVAPHLILKRAKAADAEGLGHLLAEFALLAGQRLHRLLEEAWHQQLHAVAIETNQLPQKGDWQQALAFFVFLLENDLRQHRAGDVLAALGVINDEILAGFHHDGEVLKRHVGAGSGVVEAPVGVFLDRYWLFFFCFCCHGHRVSPADWAKHSRFRRGQASRFVAAR